MVDSTNYVPGTYPEIVNDNSLSLYHTGQYSDIANALKTAQQQITALQSSLAAVSAFTTGDCKATFKAAADPGWVMANDGTIGDALSGATTRHNDDTLALYTLLWNNVSQAFAPVASGRGASAAADFAAHKVMTLPQAMGRSLAVAGAGSGLTFRSLGSTAGSETETPTIAKTAAHSHTPSLPGRNFMTFDPGNSSPDFTFSGPSTVNTEAATATTGTGSPLNILDPSIYVNFMIKL